MGKIIILDENTVNKIAAGEVVERPASVVKELVENSIDAGATVINVEIRNGGISFIRVTDNGCGMSEDDAAMAFESHATSKIRRADDLVSITSMGFRGEALASIAAVSRVRMLTRTHDSVQGVCVTVAGGTVDENKPAGCPAGTSITVSELFFNTPARYKFLKKDAAEAGYVADILNRIALAHPEISFSLVNNGRKVMHTPGNGDLKSAIFSIYGAETAKYLAKVDYEDKGISVTGFAGLAETARSSRVNQSIYINKRYIRNKTVTSAIDAAYTTFMMKGKYPFIVLNIGIDPSKVDVNVHPSKMEVKFSNEQDIFRAVYHAVNNALLSHSSVRTLSDTGKGPGSAEKTGYGVSTAHTSQEAKPGFKTYTGWTSRQDKNSYVKTPFTSAYTQQEFELVKKELDRKYHEAISGRQPEHGSGGTDFRGNVPWAADPSGDKPDGLPDKPDSGNIEFQDELVIGNQADIRAGIYEDRHDAAEKQDGTGYVKDGTVADKPALKREAAEGDQTGPAEAGDGLSVLRSKPSESRHDDEQEQSGAKTADTPDISRLFENTRIIGQLFSTYILLEGTDELFLLDQHAAHERIRYEKLKKAFEQSKPISQMLLSAVHVDLTGSEYEFAMSESAFFEKLGFTFESFGMNSVIIRSAPLIDDDMDVRECFTDVLDFVMNQDGADRSLTADEALYRLACRSAVKAHKRLDEIEIKALLADLSALENPYTCPHGRPAIYRIRRYDLEKLFKRIV
ncbi:MAG TPA: DNA mismatch repair endonuclease MutL [Clostridiales bacterium]|nr:DNA mismatch repair endonuclease MutL [Clostridiales bacterium]